MDRYAPVTDPTEVEELLEKREDIGTPFSHKSNGRLGVLVDELKQWRARPREPVS